jgi:hypothetical protein
MGGPIHKSSTRDEESDPGVQAANFPSMNRDNTMVSSGALTEGYDGPAAPEQPIEPELNADRDDELYSVLQAGNLASLNDGNAAESSGSTTESREGPTVPNQPIKQKQSAAHGGEFDPRVQAAIANFKRRKITESSGVASEGRESPAVSGQPSEQEQPIGEAKKEDKMSISAKFHDGMAMLAHALAVKFKSV